MTAPNITTEWTVAPQDQGQMLEVAYAADWESGLLYRRETDRSGPEVRYFVAPSKTLRGEWEPQNSPPDVQDWAPWADSRDPAAVSLGRRGGAVRSEAKASASRANGAKGGRPPKAKD